MRCMVDVAEPRSSHCTGAIILPPSFNLPYTKQTSIIVPNSEIALTFITVQIGGV